MPIYAVLPIIAVVAIVLAKIPEISQLGFSALPLAIVLGVIYGQFSHRSLEPKETKFSNFCKQKLLRSGIILFGFGLSFQQIIAVGWQAILLDFLVITIVFVVGTYVGIKVLKLHRDIAILTAAGSAICGAAAVLATESMLKPSQQHVTIAIATVVLFGTLAMFSYPLIYQLVDMNEHSFGIYIGSTVHEVAQAVAAGQSISAEAMQTAVVVKLIRVMLLAPFILVLSTVLTRIDNRSEDNKGVITIPWFVFGFMATVAMNSLFVLPEMVITILSLISQFFLAIAMAALGVGTHWKTIKQAGAKPLFLALLLLILLLFGGFFLNSWLI